MFINYSHPSQLRDAEFRRVVKSHAARRPVTSATLSTRHRPGSFRWKLAKENVGTRREQLRPSGGVPQDPCSPPGHTTADSLQNEHTVDETLVDLVVPLATSGAGVVGGAFRTDPFKALPIDGTTYVYIALDYYAQTWAPSIGAFPGGEPGMAAALTIHLPWCMQEAESFEATVAFMLCSLLARLASQSQSQPDLESPLGRAMMLYRGNVLASLRQRLGDERRRADNTAIHTVCTLMTIDFILGRDTHIVAHSRGLDEMVRMRGGIARLGLKGIMADAVRSIKRVCERGLEQKMEKESVGALRGRETIFQELSADLSRRSPERPIRAEQVMMTAAPED